MKISEEFNTSFELRAAEIRSLRNDFDEQLNMVSHLLVIYVYESLSVSKR